MADGLVAGWTVETASAQPLHRRDRRTQNRRSEVRRRGRGAARRQWVPQREVFEHQGAAGPEREEEAREDEVIMPSSIGPPKVNVILSNNVLIGLETSRESVETYGGRLHLGDGS